MKTVLSEWIRYYTDIGLREEVRQNNIDYITPLLARGRPPIFDFEHLSLLLGRTRGSLASMINSPKSYYRQFKIPKRTGGSRTIHAPYPSLCECQRWILDEILYKTKISRAAHGFVKGKSILTNSKEHTGKDHIIKIDLKDFFPSIHINRVFGLFSSLGYNDKVSFYLARLCTYENGLLQGSPASPFISNIIAYSMDRRLIGYLKRKGAKYTRYADDITISSNSIKSINLSVIYKIIEEEGFQINHKKTIMSGPGQRKIITGIDISSGQPRPLKKFRRFIIQEAYYISRFGISSHMKKRKIRDPYYKDSLNGKISFWEMIDPHSSELSKVKSWLKKPFADLEIS